MARLEVSVANLPTPLMERWLAEVSPGGLPPTLRLVVIGTDRAPAGILRRFREVAGGRVELVNAYGPTEATITATVHRAGAAVDGSSVPIGRPIANTECYVLDPGGEPVPV